jgi:hypothetical protein
MIDVILVRMLLKAFANDVSCDYTKCVGNSDVLSLEKTIRFYVFWQPFLDICIRGKAVRGALRAPSS